MTEDVKKKYTATIGLEIHAELKTKTKMFCSCKNDPDEEKPNSNICSICTAQPGTLPVINKEAVKHVLKIGLACNSKIADFTEWDRKNYFYPDIPKGYQISQYKYPLVIGGNLKGVELTRVHLEEDTGASTHDAGNFSLVNFNRSGVPLMELVTEPVIHSGKQAADFAKELQLLLQYMGAGDANMEKGEMRVEANVSVSPTEKFGTKVEIKNLNSFRTLERALAYEIERQIDAIEKGEKIIQETRGWDEAKQKTFSQRIKEESHDYRYFPDPDLPKMMVSEVFDMKELKKELPELPWERRERYVSLDVPIDHINVYMSNNNFGKKLGRFFDMLLKYLNKDSIRGASNYVVSDVAATITQYIANDLEKNITEKVKISGRELEDKYLDILLDKNFVMKFSKLVLFQFRDKKIDTIGFRLVFGVMYKMYKDNLEPEVIAEELGLFKKISEDDIKTIAQKLISQNPKVVADYKAGKEVALMFFVGQIIKVTKGSSNPQVIKKVLVDLLN